ncbi:hypothetical protein [uncultured Nevskia sp.]|uniref:hypothetical protein n=1 Tax=uncultured Nevskia sp. TaxID=228950 RepID=UPI0025EB29DD|nr:hypothetical protein [uncultured Nevskia sp.]
MTKDETKAALKEALHEWLDDKFVSLGKWSLGGICAAGLGLMAYFLIVTNGWHK